MRKGIRFITIVLILFTFFLFPSRIYADSGDCDNFQSVQSVILSERTHGTFEEDLEIARVVITKGACERDGNFYSGYAIAQRIVQTNPMGCISNIHCRAYFLPLTIEPSIREPAALAAHIALTESPRVPRYHFDSWGSTAFWWNSLAACPNGFFIVGLTKVC